MHQQNGEVASEDCPSPWWRGSEGLKGAEVIPLRFCMVKMRASPGRNKCIINLMATLILAPLTWFPTPKSTITGTLTHIVAPYINIFQTQILSIMHFLLHPLHSTPKVMHHEFHLPPPYWCIPSMNSTKLTINPWWEMKEGDWRFKWEFYFLLPSFPYVFVCF